MLNPLILATLKQDPTKLLRLGIAMAVASCALLARIGIVNTSHQTIAQVAIAHWLGTLMAWVFWIAIIVSGLERAMDVKERSSEFGLLRILGASNGYLLLFVVQETAVIALPAAVCGVVLAYFTSAVLGVVSAGLVVIPISWMVCPLAAFFSSLCSLLGAIVAIPGAIAAGLQEAL